MTAGLPRSRHGRDARAPTVGKLFLIQVADSRIGPGKIL
jgi:hypothetical protein